MDRPEGFSLYIAPIENNFSHPGPIQYGSMSITPTSRVINPQKAIRVYSPLPLMTNCVYLNRNPYQPPMDTLRQQNIIPYADPAIICHSEETDNLIKETTNYATTDPFIEPLSESMKGEKQDSQKRTSKPKTVTFCDAIDHPTKDLNRLIIEFQKLKWKKKSSIKKISQEELHIQHEPEVDELPKEIEPEKNLKSLVHDENPTRVRDEREVDDLWNKILNESVSIQSPPRENQSKTQQSDFWKEDIAVTGSCVLAENLSKPTKKILPLIEIEKERKKRRELKITETQLPSTDRLAKKLKKSHQGTSKKPIQLQKQYQRATDLFAEEKEEFLKEDLMDLASWNKKFLQKQKVSRNLKATSEKNIVEIPTSKYKRLQKTKKLEMKHVVQERKIMSDEELNNTGVNLQKAKIVTPEFSQLEPTLATGVQSRTEEGQRHSDIRQTSHNDAQLGQQISPSTKEQNTVAVSCLPVVFHNTTRFYNIEGSNSDDEKNEGEEEMFIIIRNGVQMKEKLNKYQWVKIYQGIVSKCHSCSQTNRYIYIGREEQEAFIPQYEK